MNGTITAVGEPEAVRAALPPEAESVDLGGRTVVPGLIDAHQHFAATAETMSWIDLRYPAVASIEQILVLLYVHHLQGAEIGRILGVSESRVSQLLTGVRRTLKERLDAYDRGNEPRTKAA